MHIIDYKKLLTNLEKNKNLYQHKKPFKYIVLDNFLNLDFAEGILDEFPLINKEWKDSRGHNTQNKWALPIIQDKIASNFMTEVKSKEFLNYLEKITLIPDLIFDPDLSGAGYHQSTNGGFLNVHIDFNKLNSCLLYTSPSPRDS